MTRDDSRRPEADGPDPADAHADDTLDELLGALGSEEPPAAPAPPASVPPPLPGRRGRAEAEDEITSTHATRSAPADADDAGSGATASAELLEAVVDAPGDEVEDLLDALSDEIEAGGPPIEATPATPAPEPPPVASAPPPSMPPPTPAPRSVPPPIPTSSTPAPRPSQVPEEFERESLALVHACEEELTRTTDPRRAARLHYEVARIAESTLGDLRRASAHYHEVLERTPEHLPSIRGARRVLVARGQPEQAVPLFDAEARLTPDPRQKAALFHRKGRLLEDVLEQRDAAKQAYATALELDRGDPMSLKALALVEAETEQWDDLGRTFEKEANAVASDPRHRAAVIVERARLVENRRGDVEGAIELYETALRLDSTVHEAVDALKRLHFQRRRWRDLIRVLQLEAELTDDAGVRSMALYRAGHLHAERLGNREEALVALEHAAELTPREPLVLGELARLYDAAERWPSLVLVLERLVDTVLDPEEKLPLLQRMGELCEEQLGDEDAAIACHARALGLRPDHRPALQALGKLLARREDWERLLEMHFGEAEATGDADRRAAAYARMAELLELRLGRSDEAVELHRRALGAVPGFEPSFKALVRLYTEKGRWHDLVELHERAIEGATDRTRAISHLFQVGALLEDALGDPAGASLAYRRVLELDADHLGAIHALQRSTERAGRHRELVAALELEAEKTRDASRVVALLHRAGEILDDPVGDREAAVQRFRRALAVDPKHLPSLTSLGRIYYRSGRWEDLLEMFQRELDITPHGPGAVALLHKMGELCHERIGREEEALGYWRRAVEMDPGHGPSVQALGRRLRERGDWAELARILEVELENLAEPADRARAAYRLGEVYEERLGQGDLAIAAYGAALGSVPEFTPAREALARLRTEQRAWGPLVEQLEAGEPLVREASLGVDYALRQGLVWAEELHEPRRAIACFERVLTLAPGHLGALLQLERLYRRVGQWEPLAAVYEAQARELRDSGARITALRELARLAETHGVGAPAEPRRAYLEILSIAPDDRAALEDLERIALADEDRELLLQVDRRLASLAVDPILAASHWTRLAESLEARGAVDDAVAAYRSALDADAANLAATRGLSRLAERLDAPEALVEASRREAEVAGDRRAAARLLVRAATVREERLGDRDGAIGDLERALELAPDHADAAARLTRLLGAAGDHARLVELLTRASTRVSDPERIGWLGLELSRLYADHLDNVPAAISALNRVLRTSPEDVAVLRRLAAYFLREGQSTEAANLLGRVVQLGPDRDVLRDVHLDLASIWADDLGETGRALVSLQAALALDPSHRVALERTSRLQEREGDLEAAADAAAKLVRAASTDVQRAAALVRLAEVELARGHETAAADALVDAVVLEGPGGEAALELKRIARTADVWARYAGAVDAYREGLPAGSDEQVAVWLEVARITYDRLGDPEAALARLRNALDETGGSPAIRAELAARLRMAGAYPEAVQELRALVQWDPGRAEPWRDLALTYDAMEAAYEARLAREPLVLLGDARGGDLDAIQASPPRVPQARPGALDADDHAALTPAHQRLALELLAALADALPKLFVPDLEPYGLSTRDRMTTRQGHPLRQRVDRIAEILGAPPVELYMHRVRSKGIGVELSSPPALLVPAPVADLPEPQQVFLLARPLYLVARRIHPVAKLQPREIQVLLAAAARQVDPSFGAGLTSDEYLQEHGRRLQRALPRRARRTVEDLARRHLAAPPVDFPSVVAGAEGAALRVAAVLADDLQACVEVLQRTERDLQGLSGAALLRRSGPVHDVVRFWLSDDALALRRRLGYVP